MELLFVYIENYKCLKKESFNLSPKYEFSFDHKKKYLSYIEKEYHLGSFFGNSICNVSGVIGGNGKGKTTFLEFLVLEKLKRNLSSIMIYRDHERQRFVTHSTIKYTHKLPDSEFSMNYHLKNDSRNYKSSNAPENLPIYYSNYFQGQVLSNVTEISAENDTINISTDTLVYRTIFSKKGATQYNINEKIRMIHFYSSFEAVLPIGFERPQFIFLDPNFFDIKDLISTDRDYNNPILFRLIDKLYNKLDDQRKDNLGLKTSFLLSVLVAYNDEKSTVVGQDHLFKFDFEKVISNDNSVIKEGMSPFLKAGFQNSMELLKNLEPLLIMLDELDKSSAFELKNKNVKISEIIGLFTKISDYRFNKIYPFDIVWSHDGLREDIKFSAGENTLISLFSRIHDCHLADEKRTVLFLLDEPDLSLHPNWQKNFLSLTIEFITKILPNARDNQIQFLITSHSPFIASDLPNNNVIYLGEKSDQKTFASNIHELLADIFFLKEGFIGKFSQKKLEGVIDYLSSDIEKIPNVKIDDSKNYCRALINQVGEPLIYQQLNQMFNEMYPSGDKLEIIRLNKLLKGRDEEIKRMKDERYI